MAGTFVTRLKRPFLRIRRCRSLKVGSNELHLQETSTIADVKKKTSTQSFHEKVTLAGEAEGGGDRCVLEHHSLSTVEVATARKASVETLVDSKRRRSDEWRRRRRRTFDGGNGRMCRDGSLETLFQDAEASEASSQSVALCAAPILRKLSSFFALKKQVEGAKSLRVSCIQGLDWSANLQNYRPMGYKLFSKRKRSLTLYKCKKDIPALEDTNASKTGGRGSVKTSPRRTTGRELTSSPASPPVTLARSEEASPFVLEETSVYDDRIRMKQGTKASGSARCLSPITREPILNSFEDDDDEELGIEEDDSYSSKYAGVPQSPSMVFYIRPRRYTLAPSRFQREHLERLRNAAKVSPSRRNSEDL